MLDKTLKEKYETGNYHCIVKCKGHVVIDKLKPKSEPISDYLLPGYQFKLGDSFYHIDFPNSECEVIRVKKDYAYLLIANPPICKAFTIRTTDLNKTFFDSREKCLDARIERTRRNLELEISFKERKI